MKTKLLRTMAAFCTKVIAVFGGDGNQLLFPAVIVHQSGVAIRGKGRRFLRRLHLYVGIVGFVSRFPAASVGGHRKTAHENQGGTKRGHSPQQFSFHRESPPLRARVCQYRPR